MAWVSVKSQGIRPYFTAYPDLSPSTDIITFLVREHTVLNKEAYGAIYSRGNLRCRLICATKHIMENILYVIFKGLNLKKYCDNGKYRPYREMWKINFCYINQPGRKILDISLWEINIIIILTISYLTKSILSYILAMKRGLACPLLYEVQHLC